LKQPNSGKAVIHRTKIVDYLLSDSHPHGRHKAAVFSRFGFTAENWETLASSLKRHAIKKSVAKIEDTPFGTRYTIEGGLELPNGGSIAVRSVWFVEKGEDIPSWLRRIHWRGKNNVKRARLRCPVLRLA